MQARRQPGWRCRRRISSSPRRAPLPTGPAAASGLPRRSPYAAARPGSRGGPRVTAGSRDHDERGPVTGGNEVAGGNELRVHFPLVPPALRTNIAARPPGPRVENAVLASSQGHEAPSGPRTDNGGDDHATERDHRGTEPAHQPGTAGPRPDPAGLRRQGRHAPQRPDRVHLERLGGRHVHLQERAEAPVPAREPGGCPDHRHRGAPAQDLAHSRSGRAGCRRRHPGRVPRDERQLRNDTRATSRVGGRGPLALRRHGPDRRDPDVGEADRLRDDAAERGRGPGPPAGRAPARLSDPSRDSGKKKRHVMSRTGAPPRPGSEPRHNGRYLTKEDLVAKYLLLKHYRSASQPAPIACEPMDQWTQEEGSGHIQYMMDFAKRLEGTGEFVDEQALSPGGTWG